MNEERLKMISDLSNRINADENPESRIEFARWISDNVGHILMVPSPVIEQLITTLEEELEGVKNFKKEGHEDHPLVNLILKHQKTAIQKSNRVIGVIKAFQAVRPLLKKKVIEFTKCQPEEIPD